MSRTRMSSQHVSSTICIWYNSVPKPSVYITGDNVPRGLTELSP